MPTFSDVLASRLRADPGRPLVTFYDLASGERTELSVTTYANWMAKTASLLADELDLERGERLLVDLPAHWLGPVVLGAAWTVGLEVAWPGPDVEDPAGRVAGVVCGPEGVDRFADRAGEVPVVATALLPFAVRFPEPVPAGVHDLGVEVWSQPDAFTPWDPPGPDDAAAPGLCQRDLWGPGPSASDGEGPRLLCTANPASGEGLAAFTGPFAGGGSLVLAVHASEAQVSAVERDERVDERFAPGPGQPTRS